MPNKPVPAHLTVEALIKRQFPEASEETVARLAKLQRKADKDMIALYNAALFD